MPDHWHGLLLLGQASTLSATMQRAKAVSSREIARITGIAAPIWQAGFHDRALRTEDDFRCAARYLVANPLRAGLVSTLADYPYWGSRWGEDTLVG